MTGKDQSHMNDARLDQGADLLARNKPETAEAVFRAVLESFPKSAACTIVMSGVLSMSDPSRNSHLGFGARSPGNGAGGPGSRP